MPSVHARWAGPPPAQSVKVTRVWPGRGPGLWALARFLHRPSGFLMAVPPDGLGGLGGEGASAGGEMPSRMTGGSEGELPKPWGA